MGNTPDRRGLFARLEDKLKPLFGGAQVTPLDAATPLARQHEWLCDTCGKPFRDHRFDDSVRGRMYCLSGPLEH